MFITKHVTIFPLHLEAVMVMMASLSWLYNYRLQSLWITTNDMSLNPPQVSCTTILHYVIEFVSDLQWVSSFLQLFHFPPSIKLIAWYNWNIYENCIKHHHHNPLHLLYHNRNIITYLSKNTPCNLTSWVCPRKEKSLINKYVNPFPNKKLDKHNFIDI